jgi:uncharacterized protein YeaO (DUF488 family)
VPIRIVRLGAPRESGEGPRIGAVRRPPRGVSKSEYAARDFYDLWLPDLAPSAPLVSWILGEPITPARWTRFASRYRSEMRRPPAARLLALLAVLSGEANFSLGCYCEDEAHCHRSLLRELLREAGATLRP